VDLTFDLEKNIVHIRLSGRLDRDTIVAALDRTVSHEKYQTGMARLWDFRDADLSFLRSETIAEMGSYSLKYSPGIRDVKVAFVTRRDLEYGLTRMFEMLAEAETPVGVFRDLAKAETWLTSY
jgi:hypothetical protein